MTQNHPISASSRDRDLKQSRSMRTKRRAIAIINRNYVVIRQQPPLRRTVFSEATPQPDIFLRAKNAGWVASRSNLHDLLTAELEPSLNDAVGAFQQLGWNGQAECVGRFTVDHELVLREHFDRRLRGL